MARKDNFWYTRVFSSEKLAATRELPVLDGVKPIRSGLSQKLSFLTY